MNTCKTHQINDGFSILSVGQKFSCGIFQLIIRSIGFARTKVLVPGVGKTITFGLAIDILTYLCKVWNLNCSVIQRRCLQLWSYTFGACDQKATYKSQDLVRQLGFEVPEPALGPVILFDSTIFPVESKAESRIELEQISLLVRVGLICTQGKQRETTFNRHLEWREQQAARFLRRPRYPHASTKRLSPTITEKVT